MKKVVTPRLLDIVIIGYCDADWAGSLGDRRFTSRYFMYLLEAI